MKPSKLLKNKINQRNSKGLEGKLMISRGILYALHKDVDETTVHKGLCNNI